MSGGTADTPSTLGHKGARLTETGQSDLIDIRQYIIDVFG